MTTIYRKTAKGLAEIETRAHRLPPRLRAALIMVDGHRSTIDLAKLVPGEADATLQQLLADGFIDVFAVLADRPPLPPPPNDPTTSPAPLAALAPPAATGPSLESVKREAVRYLNDKLGPAAEGVAIKIERAKSEAELQALLTYAAGLLRNFGGAAQAEPFVARFIDNEPAA